MAKTMRGIFTIPSTPFDDRGRLDEEGLRRIVDFCVGCGAHGIVSPVNASEFTKSVGRRAQDRDSCRGRADSGARARGCRRGRPQRPSTQPCLPAMPPP